MLKADVITTYLKSKKPVLIASLPGIVVMTILSVLCVHLHTVWDPEKDFLRGSVSDNYFTSFGVGDIALVVGLLLGWMLVYLLLHEVVARCARKCLESEKSASSKQDSSFKPLSGKRFALAMVVISAIMLVCWLPYYLSWFPGGLYADTYWTIRGHIDSNTISNTHTLFYSMLWILLEKLTEALRADIMFSCAVLTTIQFILMAISFAYTVLWLRKHQIKRIVCIVVIAFYALMPIFPLFALSLWKDFFFALALLIFALIYIDLLRSMHPDRRLIVKTCIFAVLVAFTRNNGICIVFGCMVIMALAKLTLLKTTFKRTALILGGLTVVMLVIQGPVYAAAGFAPALEENLGMPLQQIAAVVANGGELSIEQVNYLNEIFPMTGWEQRYYPFVVDDIKWDAAFNVDVIADDLPTFWRNYLWIGVANPGIYLKAWLLNCAGFWDPFIGWGENIARYNYVMWFPDDFPQSDLLAQATGFSLRGVLEPTVFPSSGVAVWIMLISMTVFVRSGAVTLRKAALLSPVFLLWLTLMIASPLAVSPRYFYAAEFLVPVMILLPMIVSGSEDQNTAASASGTTHTG